MLERLVNCILKDPIKMYMIGKKKPERQSLIMVFFFVPERKSGFHFGLGT